MARPAARFGPRTQRRCVRVAASAAAPEVRGGAAALRSGTGVPTNDTIINGVPLRACVAQVAGAPSLWPEGSRVRVKSSVKVFHVPKNPQGLDLQGMEGELQKNAALYKGKVLSPNFPYIVAFTMDQAEKPVKFKVHLVGAQGRGAAARAHAAGRARMPWARTHGTWAPHAQEEDELELLQ